MAKKKKKVVKPDEYHSIGPFEMARFGKNVIFRSDFDEEEFEQIQINLKERYPKVVQEIDLVISKIIELIKYLPPEKVLQRAWTEAATRQMGISSEVELDEDDSVSLRMIDYLQSIIASVVPDSCIKDDISEEEWQTLRSLVDGLFQKLNHEYQLCHTALRRSENQSFDVEYEQFYYAAQVIWCNVRGHRYLFHEEEYLKDLLLPHSDILLELFGISAHQLIAELLKIQHALTRGISEAFVELKKIQEASLKGADSFLQKDSQCTFEEAVRRFVDENDWKESLEDLAGQVFGLNLFDLEKVTNMPISLLDNLSWNQGEDVDFFKDGDYAGWPLRIWPIFKRPFIKLNGRYYCFDLYSLFDNIYRVLQKLLIKHNLCYRTEWNDKQKKVSEGLPFKYFEKILPDGVVYRSVHYKWYTSSGGKKNWCEVDGLLEYDDHLFVIEVKAGAFTYTSPANDFPAYIESIKSLVLKPASQGQRFAEYLNSEDTVDIFDENHCKIGELSKGSYRYVTVCPITIDSFTELAAQSQHLKNIGVQLEGLPVWPISVDDLRVYSDVFSDPLLFLHFVEQRVNALSSEVIKTNDELDHLGLYLEHNNYTLYASELHADSNASLNFYGYRSEIDKYFADKFIDPTVESPLMQDMPSVFGEIIRCLQVRGKRGRSFISSYLLDLGGDLRTGISNQIERVLGLQVARKRPLPLSIHGEVSLTIFCWQQFSILRNEQFVIEHTRSVMLGANEDNRFVLELFFTKDGRIYNVMWGEYRVSDIPSEDLDELLTLAENLKAERVKKAGKVGRNAQCPCGSGKKFKKCCGS